MNNRFILVNLCSILIQLTILSLNTLCSQNVDQHTPISNKSTQIVFLENNINVDGILNEEVWGKAVLLNEFTQREPEEGDPVSEKTEVYLFYDQDNLYFGFRCWDSDPNEIIANEMRRDRYLLNSDAVEIYLDTYHDHRAAFYFCTNAAGAQLDGIVQPELHWKLQNMNWNGVWMNASRIDSTGWTAEVVIPFKSLRFRSKPNQIWGLNIARNIPRKREDAYWSPILRDYGWWGNFRVASFGHLSGLTNINQPLKWELKPFILTGVERDFEEAQDYDKKIDFGLDAKYLLTPNLTATLTLNTDFAQVEADQEQVNLTRFELFFPEKREFFLEAANIFTFGERSVAPTIPTNSLFFSRRIGLSEDNELVPLLGGVKMTGKAGGYSVGFLNILAKPISYIDDDDEMIKVPRTNFSVVRLQKDLFANSYIGIMGLNKQSLENNSYNRNLGIDANIYLTSNTQLNGYLAQSYSPEYNDKNYAGYLDYYFSNDFWTIGINQNSIQDNFEAEMGFFPRTGIRKSQLNFGIAPRPGILNIRQFYIFNDFIYTTDQNSRLESRGIYSGLFTLFKDESQIMIFYLQNYEYLDEEFEIHDDIFIPEGIYRFDNISAEYQMDRSKPFAARLRFRTGNFYNGNLTRYGIRTDIKFGKHFSVSLEADHNDVKLSTGNFKATILGARMVYSFSPYLFLKPYIQWNSDTKKIVSNFLFNFIHTPGSDLFFVYNEELDILTSGTKTNNRTVLLKFTYLFNI